MWLLAASPARCKKPSPRSRPGFLQGLHVTAWISREVSLGCMLEPTRGPQSLAQIHHLVDPSHFLVLPDSSYQGEEFLCGTFATRRHRMRSKLPETPLDGRNSDRLLYRCDWSDKTPQEFFVSKDHTLEGDSHR